MDLQARTSDVYHHDLPSIRSFIISFLREKSPATLTAYKRDLKDFALYLSHDDIEEALHQFFNLKHGQANFLVLNYKSHLKNTGLQPSSINRRLSTIRSIAKLANLIGFTSWKIEVENLSVEIYRDTSGPGIDSIRQMIKECDKFKYPQDIRNKAILRLLFDLALRRKEVSDLNIEDLDLKNSRISIIGKGKIQKQVLSLPDPTILAIQKWVEYTTRTLGPLFTNLSRSRPPNERLSASGIYKIISMIGNRINISVRPHGIRHSAITEACKQAAKHNIGIEELLDFSRHKDIRTLLIYRDRERNIQKVVSKLISESK